MAESTSTFTHSPAPPAGPVFGLIDDLDLDGPDEALAATLPLDAEPLAGEFLEVPESLGSASTVGCLDELHWRAEAGGWAPVEGVDLFVVTALVVAEPHAARSGCRDDAHGTTTPFCRGGHNAPRACW